MTSAMWKNLEVRPIVISTSWRRNCYIELCNALPPLRVLLQTILVGYSEQYELLQFSFSKDVNVGIIKYGVNRYTEILPTKASFLCIL